MVNIERSIIKYDREYRLGNPTITDQEFDGLVARLREENPNSKVLNLIGDYEYKFEKVHRTAPMLSIKDSFTENDIRSWAAKHQASRYIMMHKLDGAAVEVYYENGIMVKALSRGNGYIGDDITHTVRTIKNLPLYLDESIDLIVRGEVVIPKDSLPEGMANCRNAAAGSLRQKDEKVAASRNLQFYTYYVISDLRSSIRSSLNSAWRHGLTICPHIVTRNTEELIGYYRSLKKLRNDIPYDIDGIVIAVNDNIDRRKFENKGKYFGGYLAAKFEAPSSVTIVTNIIVQKGRTGNITPVAILKPVEVAGSVITRASLFNQDEIIRLGVYIGASVVVQKSGDIIPQIQKVIGPALSPHILDNYCPNCDEELDKSNVVWRCTNELCDPVASITYAVSRDCMNINGLSTRLIEQLVETNLISCFVDLFDFKLMDFRRRVAGLNGWGYTRTSGIARQVMNMEITPSRFYKTLSIPSIGEEKSKIIGAMYFNPADFIDDFTASRLHRLKIIGNVAYNNLVNWLDNNLYLVEAFFGNVDIILPFFIDVKTFVLTGKMSKPRSDVKELIEAKGHDVKSSMSKSVDYLVCADVDSGSSKLKKAKKFGITIISEGELDAILDK